ncbi:hypothetical protein OUZ56_020502 [Daphnia magna]|uniref:Uncharacterized protein n=1 Tax=Daphnia magna TaxID=35525 RepID=A0ABQ9ZEN0_9CRUS|nr:hypothetical protein OUZ56_020502 [Daphnia magna]
MSRMGLFTSNQSDASHQFRQRNNNCTPLSNADHQDRQYLNQKSNRRNPAVDCGMNLNLLIDGTSMETHPVIEILLYAASLFAKHIN